MLILHDDAYYESRKPQPDLGMFNNFLRFIWDNERKAFFDRTAKGWALVFLFYAVFFGVLFSLFALKMFVTMQLLYNLDRPYVQKPSAIAKSYGRSAMRSFFSSADSTFGSPGMGFKPNILTPTTSPIIWVSDAHGKARPERYIRALDDALQEYRENNSSFDKHCLEGQIRDHADDTPCFFDINSLGVCSKAPYGYLSGHPCVILKFNRRFDWVPNYYNDTSDLPANMPESLKSTIRLSKKFYIWISCDGAHNADKEHIGDIDYYPNSGFPIQFFPFEGQKNYISPVVALHFKSLTVNRLVTVECTAWAQNIEVAKSHTLDFQIMIGVVGLFYLIFFSGLALMFAICMKTLLTTLSDDRPRWILESSIIGVNPGMGFRPGSENTVDGSLISYTASNATDVRIWTNRIDNFLKLYRNSSLLPNGGRNQQICSEKQPPKQGNVCAVDLENWGACSSPLEYGYKNSAPCVFIKLNRIYGWTPIFHNRSKGLPPEMPEDLQHHIGNASDSSLSTVWVSCAGQNPDDQKMIGEMEYYPKTRGFSGYYYPYTNTPGYLSPLVAVHFLRPRRNVLINVECRAWAKNVQYNGNSKARKGSIHFQLMIND